MELFYNPFFTGQAYVNLAKSPVLFDAKIVNTRGLCSIIALHAGICSEVFDYGKRFVDYFSATKKYMAKNPHSIIESSFNIDKLNTVKKCLEWRDALAAAGWNKNSPAPSERIKLLCGIEEYFHDKSYGEQLLKIIEAVQNGCRLPDFKIVTASYYEYFSPAEVRLLEALKKRGVCVTDKETEEQNNNISKILSVLNGKENVELNLNDESFEIWNFAEKDEALKYLSRLESNEFDVWINADNKEFDNWHYLEGKKLSGSQISGVPLPPEKIDEALAIAEKDSDEISGSEMEFLTEVLSSSNSINQYPAQVGCKNIINSFSDFCDLAEKTIWCDFYQSGQAEKLTYSFLSPVEKDCFRESLSLWDEKKERKYLRNLLLTPFSKTQKKLVLVTLDKIGSADAPKSPVFIQLKKYFEDKKEPNNFKKNKIYPFVKQKKIAQDLYEDINKIDNRMESKQEFIHIKNTEYIEKNWPEHLSYSALESLIPHPLDYVIEKFAKFSDNTPEDQNYLSSQTGTVAHKVIELLFSPDKNTKESGSAEYIQKQIGTGFDKAFEEALKKEGEILLQEQTSLDIKKFKTQLKDCLEQLLKGIKENSLHVLACEKEVVGKVGTLTIKGFIDMLLADSDGNIYIFDFKWTSSADRHANLIKENKSYQFALYEELVEKEMKANVKNVAYFLMPAAKFVSSKELKGAINFQKVELDPERKGKNLLEEIQKSYDYRKKEISEGKLEENSNWEKEDITYENQIDSHEFMPVDYYKGKKSGAYNDIGVLKSRK